MKFNFKYSLIAIITISFISIESCKNEIEIFAPESDITVIYGLLDVADTVHQIKINKVFQGDKAISELARDKSLSEYENLDAKIIEYRYDGFDTVETGNSWTLNEFTITNKDSGIFYYPEQKIYQFAAKLQGDKFYKVEVNKGDDFPLVYSTTELINILGSVLIKPKPASLTYLGLGLAGIDGPKENNIVLEMKMPINTKVIEAYLDFSWRDQYKNGGYSSVKTIKYRVGTEITANIPRTVNDNVHVKIDLNPTAFYQFIANSVSVVSESSNILQRVPEDIPLNFRFIMGGDEFNTYLEVSSPSTSLLETKPEYTNILNGVGLLSCRGFQNKDALMSKNSMRELVDGEITAGRKFCNSMHNTDPSYCY